MLDLLRFSPIFLDDLDVRVWTWILWSSNTSRSTRPPRWGDARIALMAASTPTWAPHATLRWSWPRRSRLSPNQRRRSPRRKRYEDVNEWHVPTNWCFCSLRLSEHIGCCCTDDHLGHLWMNHENKLLNLSSTSVYVSLTSGVSTIVVIKSEFSLQVSQKKLKKQKLMAREWIWIKVNTC